jgi:hypothetical protein
MATNLFEDALAGKPRSYGAQTPVKFDGGVYEALMAEFLDPRMRVQPRPLYRHTTSEARHYFAVDLDAGLVQWFKSVTTAIKAVWNQPHLQKWIMEVGTEEAERIRDEAAAYGTFMHAVCGEYLQTGELDLSDAALEMKLFEWAEKQKMPTVPRFWRHKIKQDAAAFAQWVYDYDVRPLAIEILLSCPDMQMAGAIDLVVEMNDKRYTKTDLSKRKRIVCMVDMKSTRKGAQDTHRIQMELYLRLWRSNFPDVQIDELAVWSPKNWEGREPSYSFSKVLDRIPPEMVELVVQVAKIMVPNPSPRLVFTKPLRVGEIPALTLAWRTPEEIILDQFSK